MLGQQPHDSRAVWLNPRTANALSRSGIPSGRRDLNALNVLLHEYAHVGQAGPLRPQLLEGGADAWAASRYGPVARGLRWPRSTGIADMVPRPGYPQFMEPVARQGRGFVERGQFGRR